MLLPKSKNRLQPRGRPYTGHCCAMPCRARDGRRFRVLCVIDDFSRECLAAVVDTSLSGQRVGRELDSIARVRGYPCMVVSDNHCPTGDLQCKSAERGLGADLERHPQMAGGPQGRVALHRSGKAHAERLRRELQWPPAPLAGHSCRMPCQAVDECLNEHLFANLRHARELIAEWRDDHNHHRPHTSLDGLTPWEYHQRS